MQTTGGASSDPRAGEQSAFGMWAQDGGESWRWRPNRAFGVALWGWCHSVRSPRPVGKAAMGSENRSPLRPGLGRSPAALGIWGSGGRGLHKACFVTRGFRDC